MNKHRTLGASDATLKMARRLRREMSLPEILLWQQLKTRPGGFAFRKQHPIGTYSLDFACVRARLDIEVDGEAHERGDRPERDAARDVWVKAKGFATLRIPAREVLRNMEGVIIGIVEACRLRAKPNPPRNGEVARSGGGVGGDVPQSSGFEASGIRPLHHPAGGPPPRSGEDLP